MIILWPHKETSIVKTMVSLLWEPKPSTPKPLNPKPLNPYIPKP